MGADIIRFQGRRHARASSGTDHKSGRNSCLGTPVSRSIKCTNSAATPCLERVSQYQTLDCEVPMRSAKGFCPPAISQARLSASVDMPNLNYQNLGKTQSKNLSENTNRNFGSSQRMPKRPNIDVLAFKRRVKERREAVRLSQTALGKLCGYSQSNIAWIEDEKKDGPLDPRVQAHDLAEHLRTTAEWLLYGTGVRETSPGPMSAEQIARDYQRLGLAEQEAITLQIQEYMNSRPQRRKLGAT